MTGTWLLGCLLAAAWAVFAATAWAVSAAARWSRCRAADAAWLAANRIDPHHTYTPEATR